MEPKPDIKLTAYNCVECTENGVQKEAEIQLCGKWLCQHHVEEHRKKGVGILYRVMGGKLY